jgi:23S rRNA U2552 (ribose-2'-O)-methylase RlmE/FtsJ
MLVTISGTLSCTKQYRFGELGELAEGKTDKAMAVHGFVEPYEYFFLPFKNSPIKFFEIGIAKGGSLKMWRDYFPNAMVYAIDINDCSQFESERVKTFIADQSDRSKLQTFIDKYGSDFDIILDDGGHSMDQQQISFGFLFKHVKPGGYYVIEDVHTSLSDLFPYYGADEDEKNTTFNMIYHFNRHSTIRSIYMQTEEMEYLNNNIDYCNLFFKNNTINSMTCIFKKLTPERSAIIKEARKKIKNIK